MPAQNHMTNGLLEKRAAQASQKIDLKINSMANAKMMEKEIFERKQLSKADTEQALKEIRTIKYLKEHSKVQQSEYVDIIMAILGALLILAAAIKLD